MCENDKFSIKMMILKDFGYELSLNSLILDFGCGSGKTVKELCDHGYQSFGCDIDFKTEENVDTESLKRKGIIRLMDLSHFAIPFEDNTFDFIFSDQVFEHVQNYPETCSEIARVLKPNGVCLHIFPSRYRPIEAHVYIPFSSIIRSHFWIYFWTIFGIRKQYTEKLSAKETTIRIYNYLENKTNYLSKKQLLNEFNVYFADVIFCENIYLKYSKTRIKKSIYMLSKILPFVPVIASTFQSRVILTRLPKKGYTNESAFNGT